MLTDAVLNMAGGLVLAVLNLLPDAALPEWLATGDGSEFSQGVQWIKTNLGPMAGWINLPLLFDGVVLLFAVNVIARTVHVVRSWIVIVLP